MLKAITYLCIFSSILGLYILVDHLIRYSINIWWLKNELISLILMILFFINLISIIVVSINNLKMLRRNQMYFFEEILILKVKIKLNKLKNYL